MDNLDEEMELLKTRMAKIRHKIAVISGSERALPELHKIVGDG